VSAPNYPAIDPRDIPKLLVADPDFIKRFWPSDAGKNFMAERARERMSTAQVLADSERPTASSAAASRASLCRHLFYGAGRIVFFCRVWPCIGRSDPRFDGDDDRRSRHLLLDESPRACKLAALSGGCLGSDLLILLCLAD